MWGGVGSETDSSARVELPCVRVSDILVCLDVCIRLRAYLCLRVPPSPCLVPRVAPRRLNASVTTADIYRLFSPVSRRNARVRECVGRCKLVRGFPRSLVCSLLHPSLFLSHTHSPISCTSASHGPTTSARTSTCSMPRRLRLSRSPRPL